MIVALMDHLEMSGNREQVGKLILWRNSVADFNTLRMIRVLLHVNVSNVLFVFTATQN